MTDPTQPAPETKPTTPATPPAAAASAAAASAASPSPAASEVRFGPAAPPKAPEPPEAPRPAPIAAKPPEPPKPAAARPPEPPRAVPPPVKPTAPARPVTQESAPASQPFRSALPVLTAVGFIFVLVILAWVWNSQVELRLRVAELSVPPPPAVEPSRVAALEARVKVLETRIGEIENRPPPAPPPPQIVTNDNSAALSAQLTDLESRLKTAEQKQGALADRAAAAQRIREAQAALDAGQPLGDLPSAPPALQKFATAKPPTEAALRLAFPAAAEAAEKASRPSTDGKSLGERILMHASSLVTVKRGSQVLVGAPATTVLGAAGQLLEAGDLAGAVAALDALDSGAAAAIAGWRSDAQALLDARAALAQMARG
jgi:hypothetical protein